MDLGPRDLNLLKAAKFSPLIFYFLSVVWVMIPGTEHRAACKLHPCVDLTPSVSISVVSNPVNALLIFKLSTIFFKCLASILTIFLVVRYITFKRFIANINHFSFSGLSSTLSLPTSFSHATPYQQRSFMPTSATHLASCL